MHRPFSARGLAIAGHKDHHRLDNTVLRLIWDRSAPVTGRELAQAGVRGNHGAMIFIAVRFRVRPERSDDWLTLVDSFTQATRAEPGNLWFDWSRSVEDLDEFVLLEAFADSDAGLAHVSSDHFAAGLAAMRPALTETPRIINGELPGQEWSLMGELEIVV
jgi:quinol monooxygenase YgiN